MAACDVDRAYLKDTDFGGDLDAPVVHYNRARALINEAQACTWISSVPDELKEAARAAATSEIERIEVTVARQKLESYSSCRFTFRQESLVQILNALNKVAAGMLDGSDYRAGIPSTADFQVVKTAAADSLFGSENKGISTILKTTISKAITQKIFINDFEIFDNWDSIKVEKLLGDADTILKKAQATLTEAKLIQLMKKRKPDVSDIKAEIDKLGEGDVTVTSEDIFGPIVRLAQALTAV